MYQADLEQFALVQMNLARELSRRLRVPNERSFGLELEPVTPGEPGASFTNV